MTAILQDTSVIDRIKVAAEWFRQSRTGEMPFTEHTAAKFLEMLGGIEFDVTVLTTRLTVAEARLDIIEGKQSFDRRMALSEALLHGGGKVVALPGVTERLAAKGGAR